MKKFIFLWSLVLCTFVLNAQLVTTIDMESQQNLPAVSFVSRNPDLFAESDENGKVDISDFEGSNSIEIRKLGYTTLVMTYEEIASSGFKIQLQGRLLNMDEVVVSANRWRQSSGDLHSKVISIRTEDVELQNPQTAADLLGISSKVFIQKSQQGGGSPIIRGFATNRLLYTVDGVRMNTAIFRSGNIQNVINIDPYAVENTEVLFGPGSMMYGSDAIGGVMSFRTLTPTLSETKSTLTKGKFGMRYSSANNEKTGHFDVNVGWKKWAFVSSFSSWDYDHLKQGSNGPDDYLKPYYVELVDGADKVITQEDPLLQIPSAYSQINMMQKVRYKANEHVDISYALHYSETSPYGRYDRHNRVKNNLPRYGEWNYGPQKWMMNHLSMAMSLQTLLFDEANLNLAIQNFEESRISRNYNTPNREIREENVIAYSANLDFKKQISEKNNLFYGWEYVLNDVSSIGLNENLNYNYTSYGPARYPKSEWNSLAFYLNDSYQISKKVGLQAGLRYNSFSLRSEFDTSFYPFPFNDANIQSSALTGSSGIVYRPNEKLILRASYGTAFRSPNVDDVGKVFDSEPGSVVVPNPNLTSENAQNLDFGIAKIFGDGLRIDLTAYYTILNDAFVRRDFQLDGRDSIMYDGVQSKVQAIQNASVTTVYGLQAGIEIKLPAGFSISSDLNYQQGEEELDDGSTSPARHVVPFFGSIRLNYKYNQLRIQLYSLFQASFKHEDLAVSERSKDEIYAHDENGLTYAPGWTTINLKALYEVHRKFDVSAGLENITDLRYRPYSSGISSAGRNFIISVIYKF